MHGMGEQRAGFCEPEEAQACPGSRQVSVKVGAAGGPGKRRRWLAVGVGRGWRKDPGDW